jgi:hypothetical protein
VLDATESPRYVLGFPYWMLQRAHGTCWDSRAGCYREPTVRAGIPVLDAIESPRYVLQGNVYCRSMLRSMRVLVHVIPSSCLYVLTLPLHGAVMKG